MLRPSAIGIGGVTLGLWLATTAAACSSDDTGGTPPACGDGVVDPGEECDDGNTEDGDGCSSACSNEQTPEPVCGNGEVEAPETCDDGNTEDGDGCSSTCTTEASEDCGNGQVDPGEECDDGNQVPGDGCENDCKETPNEVVCAKLPPLASGTCEVTAGDAEGTWFVGDVLLPTTVLKGGQVVVDAAGKISCVGCDCSAKATGMAKVSCPQGVISPSLINSHDHITFQSPPGVDSGERYEHRHEWRQGKNGHTKIPAGATAGKALIQYSELRHLMGGATSTVGSGGTAGALRNLDKSDELQELLGQTSVYYQTFPLGDSDGKMLESGCGYTFKDTTASVADEEAYFPHISEGISAAARNEFVCASTTQNGGQDLAQPQSAFIHSIGLLPIDYGLMAAEQVMMVWSPRSNIRLYGDTAQVTTAARLGVKIALGTDWLPSGSMNILRELRCAAELNADYFDGFFSDRELWRMVTDWGAEAAAANDVIGTIEEGLVADLAIFDAKKNPSYRAVIAAEPEDVAMVMRGGRVLYGDDAILSGLGVTGCDALDVCGTPKQLCVASEFAIDLDGLKTAVGPDAYPLFFCSDTTPENEPSCLPSRPASVKGSTIYDGSVTATDADGDGIEDAVDNCPKVFNPIRPMDDGAQADFDMDGEGDPCDVCPLDPDKLDCAKPDPDDLDGDGVLDKDDNCPGLKNDDQADEDKDGKGDACDPCPSVANAGPLACPASIYDIKQGVVPAGSKVALPNALVTTCKDGFGYFLQVHPDDAGFVGVEHSGIFVYDPKVTCGSAGVSAGDRLDVNPATVSIYHEQIELTGASVSLPLSSGNPIPAPHVIAAADLAMTPALDGVLATVANVKVLDVAAKPNFVVTGPLTVSSALFAASYFPVVEEGYDSVTGLVTVYDGTMRIAPRDDADLAIGPPVIVSVAPSKSFLMKGQVAVPTYPQALQLSLSRAPLSDTVVALDSSDSAVVAIDGQSTGTVVVKAGQTSATLVLDAPELGSAVVTASLDGLAYAAEVQVVDDTLPRSVVKITPDPAQVEPSGNIDMTIELDLPAPSVGGSQIALSLMPGTFASAPAFAFVAPNALTATFQVNASATLGTETLEATLDASSATATVIVKPLSGLVINEVDYDNVGTDLMEFVEIFNGTGAPLDLASHALVLVNGSNSTEYKRVDLGSLGVVAAGTYIVVGSDAALANAAAGAKKISFGAGQDYVQNGAPDAVGILNTATGELVDALSYEGSVTMALLTGFAETYDFVKGTPIDPATVLDSNTVVQSLCRYPNGIDTKDSASDWTLCTTLTPGAANVQP